MKVSEVVEIEVVEEEVEKECEFERKKRGETIWERIDKDFIFRKTKHQFLQDSDNPPYLPLIMIKGEKMRIE